LKSNINQSNMTFLTLLKWFDNGWWHSKN
jgi:hypothetical protein